MNVLSLFDGMSCGQQALESLGIRVDKYYASEIDKHAIKCTQENYPNTIQLGDVCSVKASDLPRIDLVLAGSPCQGFSFAGKQLAFDDPRSALFFEFVRIWNEVKAINPGAYFLLENVKMKKEHEIVISRYMGVAPIEINSALMTAQNRVRLYWTNIANRPYGLFGDVECTIPQPKDKGILLRDILESDVPDKYYLSDKMLQYFSSRAANFNQGKVNIREEEGKVSCLTSSMASCNISDNFIKIDTNLSPAANQDKANCFTAGGNSGDLHSDMTLIVASRGRNPENPKSREAGLNTEQQLEPRTDGKTNCLTSVQKDNLVMQINPSKESGGKQPYQQNRIYDPAGISPALCAGKADLLVVTHSTQPRMGKGQGGKGHLFKLDQKSYCLDTGNCQAIEPISDGTKFTKNYIQYDTSGKGYNSQQDRAFYEDGKHGSLAAARADTKNGVLLNGRIRRLTPVECERLQGVRDNYTAMLSDTQRYRALGNGWTIPVIAHILSFMPINQTQP